MPDQQPPMLIYGAGAMARVLFSYARHSRDIVGFTVDDHMIDGAATFCELPLHPFSSIETRLSPDDCDMIIAVGFAEMNTLRKKKSEEARAKGFRLSSFADESVQHHYGVNIGENTIILDHTAIHPGCSIGQGAFLSSNVSLGHDCIIGDYCWINAGVAMGGGCRIGEGAFFGVNASLAHKAEIGDHAFIGASAHVKKSVAANSVVVAAGAAPIQFKSQDFLQLAGLP